MLTEGIFKIIPTTRYQGSKRKILPWIYECIKDVEFYTVLDAVRGSQWGVNYAESYEVVLRSY